MHGSARHLAPCVAALVLCTTTGLALGASSGADELASLAATQRAATVELFAAETALARARADSDRHARRALALAATRERLVTRSAVVRDSLTATHARIGVLLRRLYVDGETDPLEVLLGARSLDAVLEGMDGLERATHRNRALAQQARRQARSLDAQLARLTRTQTVLAETRRRADAASTRLASATAQKRETIVALEQRQDLTAERLASEKREAERAAARVESPSTPVEGVAETALPSDDAPPAPPGAGARTLVVDAVAYHLPGRTASGLPVGVGAIAVDPAVIPLGTSVFVPGYGAAVAADVGSAIKGNIIDLWMPSTAAARAWGRRTVTITVYG